jgi:hypothetical protein
MNNPIPGSPAPQAILPASYLLRVNIHFPLRDFEHMFIAVGELAVALEEAFHGVLFGEFVFVSLGPGFGEEVAGPGGVAEEDYAGVEVAAGGRVSNGTRREVGKEGERGREGDQ